VGGLSACPEGAAVAFVRTSGTRAWVAGPSGRLQELELSTVDPMDRGYDVARQLIELLPKTRDIAAVPLFDSSRLPDPAPDPEASAALVVATADATEEAPPMSVAVALSGVYSRMVGAELDLGGMAGSIELSWFEERLSVGLVGIWMPTQAPSSAVVPLSVSQGGLGAVVRGGLRAGPVLVRAGLLGGWLRHEAVIDSAARFADETDTADAGWLGAELEVLLPIDPRLRVTAAATGRLDLGATALQWGDDTVRPNPDGTAGFRFGIMALF
jgi:hypothetical protein